MTDFIKKEFIHIFNWKELNGKQLHVIVVEGGGLQSVSMLITSQRMPMWFGVKSPALQMQHGKDQQRRQLKSYLHTNWRI